ncbi:MAG: hypothetical protein J3R72DRAFT_479131 [Linnemannia gamsii]|nr:MAG: hypothetical protein J3R72DRAFT_479131 [Linnemannia gamsii]
MKPLDLAHFSTRHQQSNSSNQYPPIHDHDHTSHHHSVTIDISAVALDNHSTKTTPTTTLSKMTFHRSKSGKATNRTRGLSLLSNQPFSATTAELQSRSHSATLGGTTSLRDFFPPGHNTMHDGRIELGDWLQKRSVSMPLVWKQRWCVLRDNFLYYYRSKVSQLSESKPLGVLHLSEYSIVVSGPGLSRKSYHAFRLSSTGSILHEHQHHHFRAETAHILDIWLEAIQAHIDHARECCSTLSSLDTALCNRMERGQDSSCSLSSGMTIIDKVLDRLQLEDDPTLCDVNDPSILILPAQEHPPLQYSSRILQQSLEPCDDLGLDNWNPSFASASALYSPTSSVQHILAQEADSCGCYGSILCSESCNQDVDLWTNSVPSHLRYPAKREGKSCESTQIYDQERQNSLQSVYESTYGSQSTSAATFPMASPRTKVCATKTGDMSSYSTSPIRNMDSYPSDPHTCSDTDTDAEIGETLVSGDFGVHRYRRRGASDEQERRGGRNLPRGSSGRTGPLDSLEHFTNSDTARGQLLEQEQRRTVAMSSERKWRWLWPVAGAADKPPTLALDKTTAESFDASNPILQSLVLISPHSRTVATVARHQQLQLQQENHYHQQQQQHDTSSLPPISYGLSGEGSSWSSFPRGRSTSVSKLDDGFRRKTSNGLRQYHQQHNSISQPSVSDILASKPSNFQAPHTYLEHSFRLTIPTGPFPGCIDPELVKRSPLEATPCISNHHEIISRHIVAPQELTRAIAEEAQGRVSESFVVKEEMALPKYESVKPLRSLSTTSVIPPAVPKRSPFRSAPVVIVDTLSCLDKAIDTPF